MKLPINSMELCEDYQIPPFYCVVVEEYELPKADTVDESVKLASKQIATTLQNFKLFPIYGANGAPKHSLLCQMMTKDAFTKLKQLVSGGQIDIDGISHPIKFVYDATCKSRRDHSPYRKVPLRKLKLFSGAVKLSGGEVDAHEWLSQATDLVDNEKELKEGEKMRILRNSLVKQALTLVTSSEVNTCKELMDLIALTYGEAHSAAHLRYKFYQMQQSAAETASCFLSRLQDTLKEYGRMDPTICSQEAELRFKVFTEGLRPDYYDLMNIHLGLEGLMATSNFPDFPKFLWMVQSFERNRRERFERTHEPVCGATNAIPLGVNLDPSKSRADTVESSLRNEVDELRRQLASLSSSKKKGKKQNVAAATVSAEQTQEPANQGGQRRWGNKQPQQRQCWNCGERGHTVFTCQKEWDSGAVKDHVQKQKQVFLLKQQKQQQQQQLLQQQQQLLQQQEPAVVETKNLE